jgi:hypothetical protein
LAEAWKDNVGNAPKPQNGYVLKQNGFVLKKTFERSEQRGKTVSKGFDVFFY